MNTALETTKTTTRPGGGRRRALMKLAGGAAALGVLATAACAPAERNTATSSPSPTQPATSLAAGDTSNGADNFYSSDRVTVQKVTFKNQYQMNVTGNLFVPNDMDRNTKNPAMVVGHPMGAVKEQSANLYAAKLAERGFVTMSLDLSYWGESEGQPRNLVAPDVYTEDFSAAVDYLRTQSFVDTERIGALGVCGSGSFVISAAKIDPRIKAVATVSMYDMGGVNRNGLRGAMTPEQRRQPLPRPRSSATSNSQAAKLNTSAAPRLNSPTSQRRSTASSTTSTAPPEATARTPAPSRC